MSRFLILCALSFALFTAGCTPAATLAPAAFHDASALQLEASDWSGPKAGAAYLRRTYEVQVGLATKPSQATSRLRVHVVRIGWDAASSVSLPIDTPKGATLSTVQARVLAEAGARALNPSSRQKALGAQSPDPDQTTWTLTFPGVAAGEALEVIADFEIPGTLRTDARWLSALDGPTAQLLIRYDVPTGAKATMQVRGVDASPLLTKQGGKQVFAVFLRDLPKRGEAKAHVRYVTISASVRGYAQKFATSWSRVASPYTRTLVEGSAALRMNHREPYRPQTSDLKGAQDAYLWVRDRLQREDALSARWSQSRPLPSLVTNNDLNATDKVHVLRWLLDAAKIPHQVAAVRSNNFASMDAALPFPKAFDGAAIYLPQDQLWLDPSCQECEPGQVRPDYRGALGILLPAGAKAAPIRLPE